MFLGPAAYINHCCSNNTEWVPGRGEGIWCAKAVQNISIGTEITTNYGDNYFGPNQQYCECRCHPDKVQVNDGKHTKSLNTVLLGGTEYIMLISTCII